MNGSLELQITEREPFAAGNRFEGAGPYELLVGRAHFAVDPGASAYADVVDLDHAPRNRGGLVEYSSDVCMLKPVGGGNRRLFFGYGNRGHKRELQFFNDGPASDAPRTLRDAGNGFLMRRGYTVVWAAWEGDLLPGDGRMLLDVPVARNGAEPLTGLVRTEFIADRPGISTFPLSGWASTRSYPAVSLDTSRARLTRRRYPGDAREPIAGDHWAFARTESGIGLDAQGAESAIVESDTHIHVFDGFEPGWIYELVYTARDPRPYGIGHAVVRDLVSFLRYDDTDRRGGANPLAGAVDKAYSWGRSQTGRCIRDFVYRGYNADARGRRVFDGVMPHVSGGGLMWMNHRFARIVSPAGQQYEDHESCADRFPFAYGASIDHLTGREGAILERPATDPLVLHTQSATEYWQRHGSLVHTDTQGRDLEPPDNVRVYLWASSQHFADPNTSRPARGVCQHYANVVQTSMLLRAMLDALDAWATHGVEPPASRIPRRADGTLVEFDAWKSQFPRIPGVMIPSGANSLPLYEFGPDFENGLLTREPPDVAQAGGYTILVPGVDSDGNDVAGVRGPMVEVPLGTYTGWNLRARGLGFGAMHLFTGSYIPFPDTDSEAAMTGDPRASVLARYRDAAGYVDAIEAAVGRLVDERLMLEEDVERAVARAQDWSRPLHDVRL